MNKGVKADTVVFLTSLLSKNAMGKTAYTRLGKLYERLALTGIDRGDLKNLILDGRAAKYRINSLAGLGYVYVELRKAGRNHNQALSDAILLTPKIKRVNKTKAIRERAYQALTEFNSQNKRETPVFDADYWHKNKNVLKPATLDSQLKSVLDNTKLNSFINKWRSTRFKFGGNSKKGIDSTALVVFYLLDQAPGLQLPYSAPLLSTIGKKIDSSSLAAGDLLFFSTTSLSKRITHVGIYLGKGEFAYVSSAKGVTTKKLSGYFSKRMVSAKRVFN